MKKQLAALAVLTVLSLALLGTAHRWVNSAREKVSLEETMLRGDRRAVEGIAAVYRTQDEKGQLRWETALRLDDPAAQETTFRFAAVPQRMDRTGSEVRLSFDTWFSVITSGSYDLLEDGPTDLGPLKVVAAEVAARTAAGEERTERLDMRDYFPYLPLQLQVILDGRSYSLTEEGRAALTDYLRFPLTKESEVDVTIEKGGDGYVRKAACQPVEGAEGDYGVFLPAWSLVLENGICLLPLRAENREEKITPAPCGAGTGIFLLPVEKRSVGKGSSAKPNLDLDPERARLLFPIAEGTELVGLRLDEAQGRLLLFTREGSWLYLTVIGGADGSLHQRAAVMEVGEDGYVQFLYVGDGFLVAALDSGDFQLMEEGRKGYAPALSGRLEEEEDVMVSQARSCLLGLRPSLHWDGERLVWAAAISDRSWSVGGCNQIIDYTAAADGFCAAVFDPTGMTYLAHWGCSLGREASGSYLEERGLELISLAGEE